MPGLDGVAADVAVPAAPASEQHAAPSDRKCQGSKEEPCRERGSAHTNCRSCNRTEPCTDRVAILATGEPIQCSRG